MAGKSSKSGSIPMRPSTLPDVSSPRYREGLHGPSCTASPGSLARTFPNARIAGMSNSITIPAGTGTAPAVRPCKRNYGLTSAGPR